MGLGWNHVTWEANKPPGAMNNMWSALSPVQQGWAALLGYGEASWNEGAAAVAAEAAEEAAAEKPDIQAELGAEASAAADATVVAKLGEDVAGAQSCDGLGKTLRLKFRVAGMRGALPFTESFGVQAGGLAGATLYSRVRQVMASSGMDASDLLLEGIADDADEQLHAASLRAMGVIRVRCQPPAPRSRAGACTAVAAGVQRAFAARGAEIILACVLVACLAPAFGCRNASISRPRIPVTSIEDSVNFEPAAAGRYFELVSMAAEQALAGRGPVPLNTTQEQHIQAFRGMTFVPEWLPRDRRRTAAGGPSSSVFHPPEFDVTVGGWTSCSETTVSLTTYFCGEAVAKDEVNVVHLELSEMRYLARQHAARVAKVAAQGAGSTPVPEKILKNFDAASLACPRTGRGTCSCCTTGTRA